MLFVKSAWPWPVSCQQDLPKCFLNWAVWATCFYRCSTHAFAITCTLPSSLLVRRFVRSTWNLRPIRSQFYVQFDLNGAVAVAVAVSGAVAVAVAVAGLTKRFFNHIQKDFLQRAHF